MAALDTNVLLRFLLQDDPRQCQAVARLLRAALESGETLYLPVSVTLELEWVLRSRFGLDKAAVATVFAGLLGAVELRFEAADAVEWALRQYSQYKEGSADFADCVHVALASLAGERPLWTFDKAAAKVDGVRLLAT